MTLKDVFEVCWNITKVSIYTRKPDGRLIHKWEFGKDIDVTPAMAWDIDKGELTVVDEKINAHGDPTRTGAEMGWGVKEKVFPKELLTAKITHMSMYSNGFEAVLTVDVEVET